MTYTVNEIFYTLQGEGANAGRAAVFCRFAGCNLWSGRETDRGGEPLLQLDAAVLDALHAKGFAVAIETNGTLPVPAGVDWVCVSPKQGAPLVVARGDELKVVMPQPGQDWDALEALDFLSLIHKPMAGPELAANTRLAIAHCQARPRWRLSLQTHKLLGIR